MRKKDITTVIAIVILASIISFSISNILFNKSQTKKEQVEVVQAISSDFVKPDSKYFNSNSLNPTRTITIGDTSNPKPF
jgi:hypothetical protein